MISFDRKYTYTEFRETVCSKCELECRSSNFCVYLYSRLNRKFEYIYNCFNKHFLRFLTDTADDILPILCTACSNRANCYNDSECIRKLRIQLGTNSDSYLYSAYDCPMDRGGYIQNNNASYRRRNTDAYCFSTDKVNRFF